MLLASLGKNVRLPFLMFVGSTSSKECCVKEEEDDGKRRWEGGTGKGEGKRRDGREVQRDFL